MRTTRRLATLAFAATAGLTLAACGSTIGTTVSSAPPAATSASHTSASHTSASHTSAPDMQPAADTGDDTDGTDEGSGSAPGEGDTGDAGLCYTEASWYSYVGLALQATSAGESVDTADLVQFLEQLRDVPGSFPDASMVVYDAAVDVSTATDQVIDDVEAGADAVQAVETLDQPLTAFADVCHSAGVDGI